MFAALLAVEHGVDRMVQRDQLCKSSPYYHANFDPFLDLPLLVILEVLQVC